MLNTVISIVFAAMVVSVMLFEGHKMLLTLTPPVKYNSISVEQSVVRAGDALNIVINLTRVRHCRSSLDSFMVNKKTGDVIYRRSVSGGASEIGERVVRVSHDVPKGAPAGDYEFVSRGFYDCYEGMHVLTFPSATFTVVGSKS